MTNGLEAMSLAERRYSRVAMWFHWIIATLIITNLFLGFFREDFGKDAVRPLITTHKSIGITVLALSLGRLAWRLSHRPPAYDAAMKAWEKTLARIVHWLFYGLMIAVPLSGWAMSSAAGRPTTFFTLFAVGFLPVSPESKDFWDELHELLSFGLIGLIVLHVGGALKHHFEGHKHVIGRMAPWFYRGSAA